MDLSIIIPMYNGKSYIQRNVEMLCSIDCDKEILIVDDGSLDDSYLYCCEAFKNNPEVKIFKKKNGGISDARNYGLRQATGKYLMFVDQDDHVDSEVVAKALRKCKDNSLDGVFWSCDYDFDGRTRSCDRVNEDTIIGKNSICEEMLRALIFRTSCNLMSYIGHIWAGVYNREIIDKGIEFRHFVDYEDDQLFVLDFLVNSNSIGLIKDVGYYWTVNPDSYSHNYRQLPEIIVSYKEYFKYIRERTYSVLDDDIVEEFVLFGYQFTICEAVRNSGISNKYRKKCISDLKQCLTQPEYRKAIKQPHPHIQEKRYQLYLKLIRIGLVGICTFGTRVFFIAKQRQMKLKK